MVIDTEVVVVGRMVVVVATDVVVLGGTEVVVVIGCTVVVVVGLIVVVLTDDVVVGLVFRQLSMSTSSITHPQNVATLTSSVPMQNLKRTSFPASALRSA